MRSLELAAERENDTGIKWLVNVMYGVGSDYGLRPEWALHWALGLYLISACFIYFFDGSAQGLNLNQYHGWQKALTGHGYESQIRRAAILPLQSIVNPFGIFGVNRLVVAATGWGQIVLSIQGLLTDALLIMAALGIRKRFKVY